MRIKNLEVKNIYNEGKKLNISFTEQENIILIRQPNDENSFIPFTLDFLEIVDCLFFNDSYAYVKGMLSNKSFIECTLERMGVEYTFGAKGSCSERKKDGKVRMQNVLDWYCIVPEKELAGENGGWLGAQLCYDAKEYFYPNALEDFSRFDKDTYAEPPANFMYGEELSWLQRVAKEGKCKVDLEGTLQALIRDYPAIQVDEHLSVRLDKKGEYALFFDEERIADEMLGEKEEVCVNFCGWMNNLHILKKLYEAVGQEGNFPIFIDNVFDVALKKHKNVLLKELEKTGRQVFIISKNNDESIKKYCDKVIVIE